MRIGHFYRSLGRPSDGASAAALSLAVAQQRQGHQVSLYSRFTSQENSFLSLNELSIRPIDIWNPYNLRKAIANIDILHIHAGFYSWDTHLIGEYSHLCKIPFLYSPHGALGYLNARSQSMKQHIWHKFIAPNLLNHARCIHVLAAEEESLVRQLGTNGRISIVPNGIDETLLKQPEMLDHNCISNNDVFKIGFLGRLDIWKKGLDRLLEAIAEFAKNHQNSWHLYVAGPDWNGGAKVIHELSSQLGISSMISILGEIPHDKTINYLRGLDVLVMPSRFEGFPLVFLEACISECPLIVSTATNTAKLVTDHQIGMIANTTDEIAKALAIMAQHPDIRLAMGKAGKGLAKHMTWEDIAHQMCKVYQEALCQC